MSNLQVKEGGWSGNCEDGSTVHTLNGSEFFGRGLRVDRSSAASGAPAKGLLELPCSRLSRLPGTAVESRPSSASSPLEENKHRGSGLQPAHRLGGSVERTTAGVAKPFVDRQANDSPQITRADLLEQRNVWRGRLDTSGQSTSLLEQHHVGWAGSEAMKLH